MPKQVIVPGHTLPFEGRVRNVGGYYVALGRGYCSCGEHSTDVLSSDGARKRWHRAHKLDVLAKQAQS